MVGGRDRFQARIRIPGGRLRLEKAVHDYFALRSEGVRLQGSDLLPLPDLRPGLHGDDGGVVVFIQRDHKKAALCGKNGLGGHRQRIFNGGELRRGDDKHAGPQQVVPVGKVGLHADRSRLGVECPVNGHDGGLFRIGAAVLERDVQLAVRADAFVPVFSRLLNPFLLGDGKVDADGVHGGDDGQGAAFRTDQVAYVRLGDAGDSVKGGVQDGVGKVPFGQFQRGRGLPHLGFRSDGGQARVFIFLFGDGVLRRQRLVNLQVVIQLLQLGLRLFQCGLGLGYLVLENGIVNPEEDFPLFHDGAVGIVLRLQVARHLRHDGGVVHPVQMAHPASLDGNVHRDRVFIRKRGHFRRLPFRFFTAGKEQAGQGEKGGKNGNRARQACQVHAVNDMSGCPFVERRLSGRQRRPCHAGVISAASCGRIDHGRRREGAGEEGPRQLPKPQDGGVPATMRLTFIRPC